MRFKEKMIKDSFYVSALKCSKDKLFLFEKMLCELAVND